MTTMAHRLGILATISMAGLLTACAGVRKDTDTTQAQNKAGAREPVVATYSIAAFDPATGDLGVAVQSKFFSVGTVVPWAKAGVGAVATQARANVTYGPEGLKLMEAGKSPEEAIAELTGADEMRETRQCGMVDAKGRAASFTGRDCGAFAGNRTGTNYTVQGNILAGEQVLADMASSFEAARESGEGGLGDWLAAALQAGEDAGGDSRGRQSAGLLVVRDKAGYGGASDRYIDLRVEDHPDPTRELSRLLGIHKKFFASRHARPGR